MRIRKANVTCVRELSVEVLQLACSDLSVRKDKLMPVAMHNLKLRSAPQIETKLQNSTMEMELSLPAIWAAKTRNLHNFNL